MRTFFSSSVVMMFVAGATMMIAAIFFSCAKSDSSVNTPLTSSSPTVHAPLVSVAPVIDGSAADGVWSAATPLTVRMQPISVPNNTLTGTFDVQVRAVHTTTDVYFLVSYPDAVADETPSALMFNGGDPTQPSNWKNQLNGQDGFAFMWDMMRGGTSAADGGGKFSDSSYVCTAACHTATTPGNQESGMYPLSGAVDLWYWMAGTTNPQGYADDQYAVGVDPGNPTEERRARDQEEEFFSYPIFSVANPDFPDNMAGGTNNGLDKKRFMWYPSAVSFDGTKNNPATGSAWAAGDIVPGWGLRLKTTLFG